MKKNCLIFLFSFSSIFLIAQTKNDFLTLIYKISTDEYIQIKKEEKITARYLHSLIDSTYLKDLTINHLGYFIKAYPNQENLQLEVIANISNSAILRMNKRDLMLEVIDSTGINIKDAIVFFKNKKIPFDKKTKTYRLKKWKEKYGQIMIKAKGEAIFYDIVKEGNRYEGYDKPFVYKLKAPIRVARRAWWRAKNAFEYGEWFSYQERKYKGYMALNQPKYRPNDTLKIKGYFTNKRGKPLKRSLRFTINNNGKQRFSKMIPPVEKGVYLLEIPLDDVLNFSLDKPGIIYVYDERKFDDYQVKSHQFDYEDYQLDEVTYFLEASKKGYEYGEKVILKATGKFKTGAYIPDGNIRLKLLTRYTPHKNINNQQFFDKKVVLKNLLWETELPLSSNKPTQILVPDSIFPKVTLPIYAEATFSNSNGEIQYKNVSFSIKRPNPTQHLSLNLEGEYVTAKVKEGFLQKNPIIEWFVYKEKGQAYGTKLIQLPYKERVNGHLFGYDISYPDSSDLVHLFLKDSLDKVSVNGKHKGNKITILCNNPHRLSITYQLFKGKILVESFQSDQAVLHINRNAIARKNYVLKYQYVWAGNPIQKEERFIYLKKELQIAIEQPEIVIPGQQVSIEIKVKNQKQRAIKGVNLTVGAINGQFNTNNHFTKLEVSYKLSKSPKIFHDISIKESYFLPLNNLPITKKWAKKTKVNEQLFSKLRFPESGIFMRYDSIKKTDFHKNIAQFAPYLIKNGKSEPIYMIYCNRKLVYYYDVDDEPPYAFIGKKGYNSIQLRTLNYTYEIDSVLLKKGQKLEFSIDVNHFPKHQTKLKIRKKPISQLMTPLEKRIISQSIFVLRPNSGIHHIYQDSTSIHIYNHWSYNSPKNIKIGPFIPNQNLKFVLRDKFINTFHFEPHFSYKLSKNRERLYENKLLEEKEQLPRKLNIQLPKEIVYSPSEILEKTPKDTNRIIVYHDMNLKYLKPSGQTQFQLNEKQETNLIAILWKPQNLAAYTLRPSLRRIQDMEGRYELTFVKKDSTFAQISVELTKNELIFLDLRQLKFQKDSLGLILHQISVQRNNKIEQKLSNNRFKTKIEHYTPIIYTNFPITITGTVTDDSGEVLVGASVLIKGTTVGTVTDINGSYTLNVPNSDYSLVISYTGYDTHEVEMTPNLSQNHAILSEGLHLEEVVVTGLGIGRKKNTTNSVATISSEALKGKVSGLSISDAKKQKRLSLIDKNLPASNQLRSNFKDYAFWQPNLITDRNGEAHFSAVFPDNLTQWQTFVIGMDKKQRVGIGFANSNIFKPLIAQLTVPRFMVKGDEVDIIGKAINFTSDSLAINTLFKIDDIISNTKSTIISDALIEKCRLKAVSEKDALTVNYQLKNDKYGDGEQRKIPIFPKGIIEYKGQLHLLESDTTLLLDFPDKNLPVTIRIEGNMRNFLMENVDYLIKYPHGCNEQTASKLMALLLAKKLKKLQGKPFLHENYIKKGIQRLDKTQNEDGSWGWWKGGQNNIWMTTYVLKALHEAKKVGYSCNSYNNGLILLTNSLSSFGERDLLNTLELFADIEQKGDFQQWVIKLDTSENILNLNQKLTLLKIKQANDLPHTLDTLFKYQQKDVFGNSYWGQSNYHWYNTDIQNSLLAYGILRKTKNKTICREIERYILRKKNRQGWVNTFQTAKVLTTFLDNNLIDEGKIYNKEGLTLETINNQVITKFPFQKSFLNGTTIRIHKRGSAPIYISAYQTFFNNTPISKSDLFEVKSTLRQKGDSTTNLLATIPAQLEVTVDIKRKAEYVMIEIPIPAGCSYGKKIQPRPWYYHRTYQPNYEVHREYFKEKVSIYCRELPIGKYTYSINLEPRFTGIYTLNPAKVEEMYFPIFYGRNSIKKMFIE